MYFIDQTNNTPLHIQLYEALKSEIIAHYQVGQKLPSIRKITTLYNLSKTTVESAFSQLYAEGYIESRPKSGYYVSDFRFEISSQKEDTATPAAATSKIYRYDFFPARLRKEDFPLKLFKRLQNRALDENLDFGAYHDGAGEAGLREQIALYLINSRGVVCDSNQIVICHGFSDAMGLLAKLIKPQYSHFGMESPGYHVAKRVFEEYGYSIDKIPVKDQGIDLDALQNSKAKCIYITPSHQYPTGRSIPISNRLKLLTYIHQIDGLIIEDDYDSELTYHTRPIPSLQGLDRYDRVVYMGTFAKSLSPALRLSYMVLPKRLLPLFHESYDAHFPRVGLILQKTMELFLKEGHWERHLRKIRTLNKKKHNLMKTLLREKLNDTVEIIVEGGGLAILIMPTVPFDWERFKKCAEEKRVKLYFSKERSGGEFEALRMGFGGFSDEELEKAVEVFAEVWQSGIISHNTKNFLL